jgi:hypothetical protein
MPMEGSHATHIENCTNYIVFLFKPFCDFLHNFQKKTTKGLNVNKGPCPLVEGLAPPLLVVVPLTFPLPLVKLILGIVIVIPEVMITFKGHITLGDGNIIEQSTHSPFLKQSFTCMHELVIIVHQ